MQAIEIENPQKAYGEVQAVAGVIVLVIVGKAGYGMRFSGNVLSCWVGFTLGALAFFALGYLVAGLAPTARIAQAVGMILAFPMMFLGGATIPMEVLPQSVRKYLLFTPWVKIILDIESIA
jgi:ABC-2 type transport system permease protein